MGWKASDISSAIKSGKKPTPGSAHRPEEVPPPTEASFPSIPEESSSPRNIEPVNESKSTSEPEKGNEETPKEMETDKETEKEEELIPLTYTQEPYDTMGISPEAIDDAHKY